MPSTKAVGFFSFFISIGALLSVAPTSGNDADRWLVKRRISGDEVHVISVTRTELSAPELADKGRVVLRSFPALLDERAKISADIYEEILYTDGALPTPLHGFRAPERENFDRAEVRTLVNQGPVRNRINLTIVGDGYKEAEKEKFFADANRLSHELFTGSTFASYVSLFNVYAVFVPSQDSGVTDGNNKKNTVLGLYRNPPGSKRGVFPGKPAAIDAAISLAPATDYPILVANDDFYGGLGGQYAITTRSVESGIVVLRHELGHNFGQVGEEYDSGAVYRGANSSPSASVPWTQWITGPTKTYNSKFLSGDYVWQPLSQGAYTRTFNFPGNLRDGWEFEIQLSSVGWATPGDVAVLLDGQPREIMGHYTLDRSFFTFHLEQSLAPGKHTIEVREMIHDGDNILAFAEIFAHPPGFDWTKDKIEAFNTFDQFGSDVGYRPTHDSCLMRDMTTPKFCAVDEENMWVRFLNRVSLVDSLIATGTGDNRMVTVTTPALTGLSIHWFMVDGGGQETEIPALANMKTWKADGTHHGKHRAKVSFRTAEVRQLTSSFDVSADIDL